MKRCKVIAHASIIIGVFLISTYSSCRKVQQNSTITYVNDTYTEIAIRVNGDSKTIPAGSSVSYKGAVNSNASLIASTSGLYGMQLSWSFTNVFPSESNKVLTKKLDVDPGYFFLEAKNAHPSTTTQLEVNIGLGAVTIETMFLLNNGNTYPIGYYQAYPATTVKAFYSDFTNWTSPDLAIPDTDNALYTITLQ